VVLCLLGRTDEPFGLTHAGFDTHEYEREEREAGHATSIASTLLVRGVVELLRGDPEEASRLLDEAVPYARSYAGCPAWCDWVFRRALAAARCARLLRDGRRRQRMKQARRGLKQLQGWATHAPSTFSAPALLLEAELAAADDDLGGALAAFDGAIDAATEHERLDLLAMANEAAGRYLLDLGRYRSGRSYLQGAYAAWKRYGAEAMRAKLRSEFDAWLGTESPEGRSSGGPTDSSIFSTSFDADSSASDTGEANAVGAALDLDAVSRAARATSGEVVMTRLHRTLVELAVQNAGAQRGLLILTDRSGPKVVATSDDPEREPVPLSLAADLPAAVVTYVLRSGRPVVLAAAAREGRFVSEPWIVANRPRSILCSPITSHGVVQGALYLENNLTDGAFPPARLRIVDVLAAQAAISLENARLVDNLEAEVRDRTAELETARVRSDELLRNILPVSIAEELKQNGAAQPVLFDAATVLFTDFVGFTRVAESMTPRELIDQLDVAISGFDDIVHRNGLEKLKTLGDGYMCAGGIPLANQTHPFDSVLAALQMQRWIRELGRQREARGLVPWGLRVGIHSGPLIAGVVGRRKFAYDVWGDAVNLASRMESSGEAGRVNVSTAVAERVESLFVLEARGRIKAKNKGEVEMFFVHQIRAEFSTDDDGFEPNAGFFEERDRILSLRL